MFWSFVRRAVWFRRRRLVLAFSALTVSAIMATVLFSIYGDIERKMRREFRSYGANIVLAPAGDARTVPLRAVTEVQRLGGVGAPFLYSVGNISGEPVVLAGVDFHQLPSLTPYRTIEGTGNAGSGDCLAGTAVASQLHLTIGQAVPLNTGTCMLRGIIATGGAEDAQLLLPFDMVARIAGLTGVASVIEARADSRRIEAVHSALSRLLPGVDVRVLRALVETESNVVLKLRESLFLLAALIIVIAVLCVMNNFSALVIERQGEIGLLKAMGAAEGKIAGLFLSQSVLLALASSVCGYLLGLGIAYWIGRQIFGPATGVGLDYIALLPVTAVTLVVAALATLLPVKRIWRMEAAVALRGE